MTSPVPWVLVTGGATRLGRAISLAFAAAGWAVAIHHRHSAAQAQALADELRARGTPVHLLCADLSERGVGARLLAELPAEASAGLRCLVNNASEFTEDSGWDCTRAHMERLFATNLFAPLELTQALAHLVCRQPPADGATSTLPVPLALHILDQKVDNLNPDYFSYTLTKLALERAVGLQAQAYAPTLRVCGLSPGLCFVSGPQTEDNFERARRVNLLRRPLDPADIARTAVHLAQTPGINGCVIPVDNGQHRLGLARDVMFAVDLGLAP